MNQLTKECASCETEWQDDFWCNTYPNCCLNCCPCAFGLAKKVDGVCKYIEPETKSNAVEDKDLPF